MFVTMSMGNITLREREINWVPCPTGKKTTEPHMVLTFDLEPPCGGKFVNVAIIHEPESPNPGLNLTSKCATLGVASIQRMLLLLEEWRADKGLPPSMAASLRSPFER
jgi:hypothetical protein